MGFYDISHNKVVWEGLPLNERTPVRYAWLRALVSPAKYVYKLFKAFRDSVNYKLAHNGQVCHLEAALNDTFDRTSRRIEVIDSPMHYAIYFYQQPELKTVFIELESEINTGAIPLPGFDPLPLWLDSELEDNASCFIVVVPAGLVFNEARMRAFIDEYRLVSKNIYSIITSP